MLQIHWTPRDQLEDVLLGSSITDSLTSHPFYAEMWAHYYQDEELYSQR